MLEGNKKRTFDRVICEQSRVKFFEDVPFLRNYIFFYFVLTSFICSIEYLILQLEVYCAFVLDILVTFKIF